MAGASEAALLAVRLAIGPLSAVGVAAHIDGSSCFRGAEILLIQLAGLARQ